MPKKIKVLHFTQALGGVETAIRTIVSSIDNNKFEPIVVSPSKQLFAFDRDGRQIQEIYLSVERSINLFKDIYSLVQFINIIRKIRPDIIHCHSSKAGFIGRFACWLTQTPALFTPHAFSYLSAKNSMLRSFYLLLEKIAIPFTTLLIACSESEYKRAVTDVKCPERKAAIWKNCILCYKNNDIKPINPFGMPFICSIGRPTFQKNIDMLLNVVENLKNNGNTVPCILLGVGHHSPEENRISKLIETKNLQNDFIMKEWISRDDILRIIKASELFVLTSRYEGLPYSIIESMSLGKVVIATDVDGSKDCVLNERTGFLVELNNVDSMCKVILEVLRNKELKTRLEKQSLEEFDLHYDATKMVNKLENIYEKVYFQRNNKL